MKQSLSSPKRFDEFNAKTDEELLDLYMNKPDDPDGISAKMMLGYRSRRRQESHERTVRNMTVVVALAAVAQIVVAMVALTGPLYDRSCMKPTPRPSSQSVCSPASAPRQ